jgi:hypothetical protein
LIAKVISLLNVFALPIYDIGTRMSRNLEIMRQNLIKCNIKGCQPKLDHRDLILPAEDVDCCTMMQINPQTPTNFMMVDVLYYIPPQDIARFFCNENVESLYSINLKTHANSGSLADEVVWTGQPTVEAYFNEIKQEFTERRTFISNYTVDDTAVDGTTKVVAQYSHKCLSFWEDNTVYQFTDRDGTTMFIKCEIYFQDLTAYEVIRLTRAYDQVVE